MSVQVVGIVLERDGVRKIASPASSEALAAASKELAARGLNSDRCNCGDQICVGGYVWTCAIGPEGECRWFSSDWQCQD